MPRNKNKIIVKNPAQFQNFQPSPVKNNAPKSKEVRPNSKERNGKSQKERVSKYSANIRTDIMNNVNSLSNKAHRSPVPNVKASPLNLKEIGHLAMKSNVKNSSVLSSTNFIKMHSTGYDYGENSEHKNTLQKFHLEKRISNSASSNTKSRETAASSRNKGKNVQSTSDCANLTNHKAMLINWTQGFAMANNQPKVRGKSSNAREKEKIIQKSFQVEECVNEDSEYSNDVSDASDCELSEEEKSDWGQEDNFSRVINKDHSNITTSKIAQANRPTSAVRNCEIPSMSRHVRRHKKIPCSVRKPTNSTIILHKPPVQGGSETIFFQYPPYVGKSKETKGELIKFSQDELSKSKLTLKISESTHIYNSVVNSCKNAGFFLTDVGKDFNLLWTGATKIEVLKLMNKFQKVNHFPGSYNLGRKDLMWKNVSSMKRKFGADYNICPKTYIFPYDYKRFIIEWKSNEVNKSFYIMKPVSSSCGRGIKVINTTMGMPKNK